MKIIDNSSCKMKAGEKAPRSFRDWFHCRDWSSSGRAPRSLGTLMLMNGDLREKWRVMNGDLREIAIYRNGDLRYTLSERRYSYGEKRF